MSDAGSTLANRRGALIVAGCAVAVAAVFGLHGYWTFKLASLLVFALAVRGLQVLVESSGQVSLGHGAFFAIGAYLAGIVMQHAPAWSFAVVPLAAVACFAAGWLFGRPATRLVGPYLALATFALAIALPPLLKHPALEGWTGGVSGLSLDAAEAPAFVAWLGADRWTLGVTLAWVAIAFLVLWRLQRGPAGLAWIMLRDQTTAAAAVGVDVAGSKALAFAVSAAATGVAGALQTGLTRFVSPDSFNVWLSLSLLVGVTIAGSSTLVGTFVAAAVLSFVPDLAEKVSQELTGILYGVVLLAVVYAGPIVRSARTRMRRRRAGEAPRASRASRAIARP